MRSCNMSKYRADVTFHNHEDYDWERHLKFMKNNPEIKYVFGIGEFGPYIEIVGHYAKVRDFGFSVFGDHNIEDYIEEDV